MSSDLLDPTPVLTLERVRKSFGTELVLDDIDLVVPEHTVTVLIGASGSGKSTLLRCVNLLEEVDDGRITLDDTDITAVGTDPDAVRRRIGTVFQHLNLFPHMSVLANITLAPTVVHKMAKDEAEALAMSLLTRFDLAGKAKEYPDRLSGGQQQRVAILRAVATSPRLLLLDEVTSALDPVLVAEVLDLVAELRADGMTMVVATHEMGFARRVADQVGFLHAGRLLEIGTAERVLESPETPELTSFLTALRGAGRL
jgi:polar amino acid transport system ATP-binding protein